jgi:regulator of sigma E protease
MISSILSSLSGIIIVALGVTVLIFVHELGHFILAKLSKVRVNAFSIGFGPKLFSRKYGETDYQVRIIPLGGFVQLAGENVNSEDRTGAPDEFVSKPPLTRIIVFSGGVVMNFLCAFPACILMYLIGISFAAPQIGDIYHGSGEGNSIMREGDQIVSVNNQPVNTFDEYRRTILRAPKGTELNIKIKRQDKELEAKINAQGSEGLGVNPLVNVIGKVEKGSSAEKFGLKTGDEILEVEGVPIYSNRQISEIVKQRKGEPIALKIKRNDNIRIIEKVYPEEVSQKLYDIDIDNIVPVIVDSVKTGSPAESAGLKANDKILEINNVLVRSWNEFKRITKVSAGKQLICKILRDKSEIEVAMIPDTNPDGSGYVGIILSQGNIIGEVPKNSPIEASGLQPGDVITGVNGVKIESLGTLTKMAWQGEGKPLILSVQRNNESIELKLIPEPKPQWVLGVEMKPKSVVQKYGFFKAVNAGVSETIDLFGLTFQLIWKLVKGEESHKGLAGPVGIFRVSYILVQKEGIAKFLWLLALFSLNLAVLNILPIPILDGGGIMFNIIEKIKGSPVSIKVQSISMYIGLFILLSLVLFATYNDIVNFILHK